MVMDDASADPARDRRYLSWLLVVCALRRRLHDLRGNDGQELPRHTCATTPTPTSAILAYSKLADPDAYDSAEEKDEAVRMLIDKFEHGHEPIATRAMICRTLGELRDPRAHDLLVKAVSSPEAVIKIEACRALGKVGRPEDATVLAQVMTLDNLEDARIAAIEGLAELKTKDPRIYQMLVDGMEHEDPAIRLASLNALRKLTGKDQGTDPADWRRELKPMLDAAAGTASPGWVMPRSRHRPRRDSRPRPRPLDLT